MLKLKIKLKKVKKFTWHQQTSKILEQIQDTQLSNLPENKKLNSIESAQSVITEEPEKKESLLPDKPPKEQYEFAVSFMKIGDYETAEFALKNLSKKIKIMI